MRKKATKKSRKRQSKTISKKMQQTSTQKINIRIGDTQARSRQKSQGIVENLDQLYPFGRRPDILSLDPQRAAIEASSYQVPLTQYSKPQIASLPAQWSAYDGSNVQQITPNTEIEQTPQEIVPIRPKKVGSKKAQTTYPTKIEMMPSESDKREFPEMISEGRLRPSEIKAGIMKKSLLPEKQPLSELPSTSGMFNNTQIGSIPDPNIATQIGQEAPQPLIQSTSEVGPSSLLETFSTYPSGTPSTSQKPVPEGKTLITRIKSQNAAEKLIAIAKEPNINEKVRKNIENKIAEYEARTSMNETTRLKAYQEYLRAIKKDIPDDIKKKYSIRN